MRAYIWILLVCCLAFQGSSQDLFRKFSSPGYPAPYPPNQTMKWTVSVPPGNKLRLQFIDFDVGEDEECCRDYVKITDGRQPFVVAWGQLHSGPGNIPEPLEFIFSSNTVNVTFTSQEVQSRHFWGFLAIYTALVFDECTNSKTPCAHYCHSYPGEYFCSCAYGYTLGSDKTSCEETVANCCSPTEIDNSEIKYLSEDGVTNYGARIQYRCTAPYYELTPSGDGVYSCSADGHWKSKEGQREEPQCTAAHQAKYYDEPNDEEGLASCRWNESQTVNTL